MAYLSGVLRVQKRYREAEAEARLSIRGLQNYGSDSGACFAWIIASLSLAKILGDIQQYEEALEIQHDIAEVILDYYGSDHPRYLMVSHDLAVTLSMANKLPEAMTASLEVLEKSRKIYGLEHPRTVNIEYNIAHQLTRQGDFKQGEEYLRRLLQIFEQQVGSNGVETVNCLRYLASCLEGQLRFSEALGCYENAHLKMLAGFGAEDEGTHLAATDVERLRQLSNRSPARPAAIPQHRSKGAAHHAAHNQYKNSQEYTHAGNGNEITAVSTSAYCYSQPSGYPSQDNYYVSGGCMLGPQRYLTSKSYASPYGITPSYTFHDSRYAIGTDSASTQIQRNSSNFNKSTAASNSKSHPEIASCSKCINGADENNDICDCYKRRQDHLPSGPSLKSSNPRKRKR
jgi:tetratricopeptide (TPR) repeat protein